jgi:hypothetical protein
MTRIVEECVLCGRPAVGFGAFRPYDEETFAAVITLRTTPLPEAGVPGILYGLCERHKPMEQITGYFGDTAIATKVEQKFLELAREIRRRAS